MILLNCDECKDSTKYCNKVISDITRVSMKTIKREKKKFVEEEFDAVMNLGKYKSVCVKNFNG